MEQCALFFDIDGTIVLEDGSRAIPDSAIKAIRQARENGHLVFINSGRVYINIEPNIHEIGFDGYVLGCGTQVLYHDTELFRNRLKKEICELVVSEVRKASGTMIYEAADLVGYDPSAPNQWEVDGLLEYFNNLNRRVVPVTDSAFTFDKFYGWMPKGKSAETFRERIAEYFDFILRGETEEMVTYEIVPKGFSKATGMQFVLDRFSIPWERSYAFGDGPNDIPMLKFAANSAAMGGCDKETGESVNFITDRIENDGLEKAISHFGLI